MKVIKIRQYSQRGKSYSVAIGNGITRSFDNLKHCKKFLADCNRFLNQKLHEANFIYTDIYALYRHNWFYFDHHKKPGAELYQLERSVRNCLQHAEDTFDLICDRSHFENGNQFVFTHFRTLFTNTKKAVALMQKLQRSKSDAANVYKLQALHDRIIWLETELLIFDGNMPVKEITDVAEVIIRNQMKAVN